MTANSVEELEEDSHSSDSTRVSLQAERVLLVEGADEERFFEALLKHLSLLGNIQVIQYGGKTNFRSFLETLVATPGFASMVNSVGVVRDADTSSPSGFQSVCDALKSCGLTPPQEPVQISSGVPAVSVYLCPDCSQPGMLETLCLRAVEGDPALDCVDRFIGCLEQTGKTMPKNLEKSRLHAFLASRLRPDLRLGEAAKKGYWPWDSQAFDLLKKFLGSL